MVIVNSFNRSIACINGDKYDRIPVIPLVIQHALHIAGIPHNQYSTSGKHLASAQIFSLKKYGYDGIHITTDNQIISQALGCKIFLPFDEPPQYVSRILDRKQDLSVLKAFDPYTDARMPVILEATRVAREELKNDYFIKVNCDSGPFSLAAALMGEEQFFIALIDEQEYAFDLLEICKKSVIKYAIAIANSGAHAITFGDSTSGLVGRNLYEKFALPFQMEVVKSIKALGLPVFMHICGNTEKIIDLMKLSGADVLEIDSHINLNQAYIMTDSAVCIEGNIDPVNTILYGNEHDVYEQSIQCIKLSQGKKFILSSGCEVPRFSPAENIKAMVKASEDMSL